MNTLRVLLVESDADESQRIFSALTDAKHAVLPAAGLDEASEALTIQKFDAVLLGSLPPDGLNEFTARLRDTERNQRALGRTPVLSFAAQAPRDLAVDGYLPEKFEPATFSEAVASLARGLAGFEGASSGDSSRLPVFEVQGFKAQVAYDDDLVVEIIDLFLVERLAQVAEMRSALAEGKCDQLARVAHTIKGSLSSLHAALARSHAQELELAAKRQDLAACRSSLITLEADLDILEPLLLALRASPGAT